MSQLRIESVSGPLAEEPETAARAATLLARGEVMGFLDAGSAGAVLDVKLLRRALAGLAERGIAARAGLPATNLRAAVDLALDGSEHNPMPAGEWPRLAAILGEELLAGLLGISASSLRRYAAGLRTAPDPVIARLHVLALVVADLLGAYNDFGIRRWFTRPREQLDGRSPLALLGTGWDPDGPAAARLRELAASLLAGVSR